MRRTGDKVEVPQASGNGSPPWHPSIPLLSRTQHCKKGHGKRPVPRLGVFDSGMETIPSPGHVFYVYLAYGIEGATRRGLSKAWDGSGEEG